LYADVFRRLEALEAAMVRILLADDHEVLRRGVRQIIEEHPGWTVCGEAANGREAVELAVREKPDVAVLDLSMPELNGLEATRQIRKALPQTEILIFTMHENEQLVREVLAAGARGYLLKNDAALHIVAAIDALSKHKPFFTSNVSETLLEGFLRAGTSAEAAVLGEPMTPREREIIQLLAEGHSNKDIARSLGISVKTVETHRATIMRKIGGSSVVDIVRYAIRNAIAHP
jgi:DNA-binding NarL/FixJ family response regulator